MSVKLIKNGMVIAGENNELFYEKGYVLIDGNKIAEVGEGDYKGDAVIDEVFDATDKAVLPGFVDAHTHCSGSLFKATTEDHDSYFYKFALPMESALTPDYTYLMTRLGATECMREGITCVNDIYHYMDSATQAFYDVGIRAVVSQNIVDVNIGNLRYNDYTRYPKMGEDFLQQGIDLVKKWNGVDDGRIIGRMGPHATDTVSLELAKKVVEAGHELGVGFHIHVAQTSREREYMTEQQGMTPMQYLEKVGLLNDNTMCAHLIYVDDNDIKLAAKGKINMMHCVEGLGKGGEMPPIKKIHDAGVRFVFATDWQTMDPWTSLRTGIMLDRCYGLSKEEMNSHIAFNKYTIEPARALKLDDKIGSLAAGKQADIQIINLRNPNLCPVFNDLLATLAYNANGHDVTDVMVAGRWTVRDSRLTMVDEDKVIDEGRKCAKYIFDTFADKI